MTEEPVVVDIRRQSTHHHHQLHGSEESQPLQIPWHSYKNVTWMMVKKAQQRLFFLRWLRSLEWALHPQLILHLNCGEHLNCLQHSLVWQQHSAKLCRGCYKQAVTLLEVSMSPSRTSTAGDVWGKLRGSPVTPVTPAMNCSLSYHQTDPITSTTSIHNSTEQNSYCIITVSYILIYVTWCIVYVCIMCVGVSWRSCTV